MHQQNRQEPLRFDRAGEHGPPLTEEDVLNSDMFRMLRNDFHPPWEVRQRPWWNPRDPFGSNGRNQRPANAAKFIPGRQKQPLYPQLSKLDKAQHLSGLKLLSPTNAVPPWNFPLPDTNDITTFEYAIDIYEKEIVKYQLWARKCWVNGDCVRALYPKPLLETVYDAQFQLKKNEIQALPNEFTMTAQIALEPREDAFIMQPLKDLKSVDVNTLPEIDYPGPLEEDVSIMRHCEVPAPCRQHPTKFILPDENTVTTLPLPEVNRQLARYAIENGATFIASEKALQCLLEYEQAWKLPVYVEEVECPGGGGVETVVVIGSELYTQKECGGQRTFKAFRHLLRTTFTRSNENSQVNSPTHQPATMKETNRFNSGEASQSNSSGEDYLQTDGFEKLWRLIECDLSYAVTNNNNAPSDAGTDGGGGDGVMVFGSLTEKSVPLKSYKHLLRNTFIRSSENSQVNSLTHQPATVKYTDLYNFEEASQSDSSYEGDLTIYVFGNRRYVFEQRRRSIENAVVSDGTNNGNASGDSGIDGGGGDGVMVFGSLTEKSVPLKSYKHLLRNTFIRSSENSQVNSLTHQPATVKYTDLYNFEEASQSDSSYKGDLTIYVFGNRRYVFEQRRRSIENAVVSDGTNNGNASGDSGIDSNGGKGVIPISKILNARGHLQNTNKKSSGNTQINLLTHQPATVEDSHQYQPGEHNQSYSSNEDEFEKDVIEQRWPSTEMMSNANDDTTDSNVPSYAKILSLATGTIGALNSLLLNLRMLHEYLSLTVDRYREDNQSYSSNEDELKQDGFEQRRRATDSKSPSDAQMSSVDTEPNRLTIDHHLSFSKDIEFEPEVSVPVNREENQTETGKNAQKKPFYFGTDCDEEPALEHILQTQGKADIEVAVPHEEQNQKMIFNKCYFKSFNFAGIRTGIGEAQNSDHFSFDLTTLHEAMNDLTGENPNSREDIDDINCSCKGTKFEKPPPRSFKKWQVKNTASNQSFDMIVHSSHKVQLDGKEVILEPIVEWQPELGACRQSAGRRRALALALMMRPNADLINVRVDYKNGNMILIDKFDEERFTETRGDKRSEIADRIHSAIEQLRLLKPGQYILAHDSGDYTQAMVYSTLAQPAGASGAHTMSLRPDKDKLTEAEEATMSKNLCFELGLEMLPYHKDQRIMPLAFTTERKHVKPINKKPLVRVRLPPPAMPRRMKKTRRERHQH